MDWIKGAGSSASAAIARLDSLLTVTSEGTVSVGFGSTFDIAVSVLASAAAFSKEVPHEHRVALTRKAVIAAKKEGRLEPGSVLAHLKVGEKDYRSTPEKSYVLLSTLSVDSATQLRSRSVSTSRIRFTDFRPRRYRVPDRLRFRSEHERTAGIGCLYVQTSVRARDPFTAVSLAVDRVDYLRGIWNLFYHFDRWRRSLAGPSEKPFATISWGPIHTLHWPDGRLASDAYWYERILPQPLSLARLERFEELLSFEKWVRQKVAGSNLENRITNLLVRYARAMDEPVLSSAFLKFWALLEDVTDTEKTTYETTIRRTAFLFKPRNFHMAVLEHLRLLRNKLVHNSISIADSELLAGEVKMYVETLIVFLITNSRRFQSLQEFGQTLDSPADPSLLHTRIRQASFALRLLRR